MSDVEKYITKKEIKTPGFRKKVEEEYENLKLGEEIRQLRLSNGMTQEELERKCLPQKVQFPDWRITQNVSG